jgi:colanic acid/amylovoran biosynthesis glycosyltransferase
MGINLRMFTYVREKPPNDGTWKLLTVARLTEKKGIIYAIQAVAELGPAYNLSYTIVGDGELRDSLEASARDLKLQGKINFTGVVSHSGVGRLLQEADVLVHPSVTAADGDQEGMPTTIKEAMARGVPVVSTTHGGITELITDGVNGLLAPERDSRALAECIRKLFESPALVERIRNQARRTVEERYDVTALNARLCEIIRHGVR